MLRPALILITVVLTGLRILGMTNGTYQAAAHIWWTGLFVAWCDRFSRGWNPFLLVGWVGMLAVEITCFLLTKLGG